eukprot:CAMPEP_0177663960 /NCGR_PEP_ID=MMETSP0447-20121125/20212_1 /TAXON_ID=0 /ORGANISM="Stygamoeba regulata, Strain BSH-02190019" /LENGTH=216 /DNA_ID=CAMNT_0019169847 /DNA_START=25 /DNA_END=678 /DNA_ORIENTATION=-
MAEFSDSNIFGTNAIGKCKDTSDAVVVTFLVEGKEAAAAFLQQAHKVVDGNDNLAFTFCGRIATLTLPATEFKSMFGINLQEYTVLGCRVQLPSSSLSGTLTRGEAAEISVLDLCNSPHLRCFASYVQLCNMELLVEDSVCACDSPGYSPGSPNYPQQPSPPASPQAQPPHASAQASAVPLPDLSGREGTSDASPPPKTTNASLQACGASTRPPRF